MLLLTVLWSEVHTKYIMYFSLQFFTYIFMQITKSYQKINPFACVFSRNKNKRPLCEQINENTIFINILLLASKSLTKYSTSSFWDRAL